MAPAAAEKAAARTLTPAALLAVLLLQGPLLCVAVRKAVGGIVPATLDAPQAALPPVPPVQLLSPGVIVTPQASLAPDASRAWAAVSPLEEGVANFIADEANAAPGMCSFKLNPPPVNFMTNWNMEGSPNLPYWVEGTEACADGSVITTLQITSKDEQVVAAKVMTTRCQGFACSTVTEVGHRVQIPDRIKKYFRPRLRPREGDFYNPPPAEERTVSVVSRRKPEGGCDDLVVIKRCDGQSSAKFDEHNNRRECRTTEQRISMTEDEVRQEAEEKARKAEEAANFVPKKWYWTKPSDEEWALVLGKEPDEEPARAWYWDRPNVADGDDIR